jgi:hypothetical protein
MHYANANRKFQPGQAQSDEFFFRSHPGRHDGAISYPGNGALNFTYNFIVIQIGLMGIGLIVKRLSIGHQFWRNDHSTWEVSVAAHDAALSSKCFPPDPTS